MKKTKKLGNFIYFTLVLNVFLVPNFSFAGTWKIYNFEKYRFKVISRMPFLFDGAKNENDTTAFYTDPRNPENGIRISVTTKKFKKEEMPKLESVPKIIYALLNKKFKDCHDFKYITQKNKYREKKALLTYFYFKDSANKEVLITEIDQMKNLTWFSLAVRRFMDDENSLGDCEKILESFEVY